jgi:hypothetical protein
MNIAPFYKNLSLSKLVIYEWVMCRHRIDGQLTTCETTSNIQYFAIVGNHFGFYVGMHWSTKFNGKAGLGIHT